MKKATAEKPTIDASEMRRLSVAASCDPRTIAAVLEGQPVRGLARVRAYAALVAAGYMEPVKR